MDRVAKDRFLLACVLAAKFQKASDINELQQAHGEGTHVLAGTAGLAEVVCFIKTRCAPLTPAATGCLALFCI
jgi:hypothetical protein